MTYGEKLAEIEDLLELADLKVAPAHLRMKGLEEDRKRKASFLYSIRVKAFTAIDLGDLPSITIGDHQEVDWIEKCRDGKKPLFYKLYDQFVLNLEEEEIHMEFRTEDTIDSKVIEVDVTSLTNVMSM